MNREVVEAELHGEALIIRDKRGDGGV
jgi:hypothetical protein